MLWTNMELVLKTVESALLIMAALTAPRPMNETHCPQKILYVNFPFIQFKNTFGVRYCNIIGKIDLISSGEVIGLP